MRVVWKSSVWNPAAMLSFRVPDGRFQAPEVGRFLCSCRVGQH